MKLTNRTISRLWAALNDLDGEKSPDGSVAKRFVFSGSALYAIARTINHLRGHQEVIERTTDALVRTHAAGGSSIAVSDPGFGPFQAEVNAMLDQEVEVTVHRVKLADLNLDKNSLRPTTLAALEPIIEE